MRLPTRALPFLARLLAFFTLTCLAWWLTPLPSFYAQVLIRATRIGLWLTEFSFDSTWSHGTTVMLDGTNVFYAHRLFARFSPPLDPQGIPAEWVMANLVLLVPLMLATPAPSWGARFGRLGLAVALALAVQVADLLVTIKLFYASNLPGYGGQWRAWTYALLDAFVQGYDAQLFPFVIWAGIHFPSLIRHADAPEPPAATSAGESRAERRRAARKSPR